MNSLPDNQREIKFRAWDEVEKKWIYFTIQELLFAYDVHGVELNIDKRSELSSLSFKMKTMQEWKFYEYTGLKDKNGVEIYEGDICLCESHDPKYQEVRFIEGGFCLWWGCDDYPTDINHFYPSTGCMLEVIGNIYENPNLLK